MLLVNSFLLLAVLEPAMWHQWVNIESANSNFYYSITLLLGGWQVRRKYARLAEHEVFELLEIFFCWVLHHTRAWRVCRQQMRVDCRHEVVELLKCLKLKPHALVGFPYNSALISREV